MVCWVHRSRQIQKNTVSRHRGSSPNADLPREKVTVTLRPESLAYADRKARERQVSRSEIIDSALAEAEEREVEALMMAGYKAMAKENAEVAVEGMESFWEIIKDDPIWPDAPETNAATR
jgi:hypothetical protein